MTGDDAELDRVATEAKERLDAAAAPWGPGRIQSTTPAAADDLTIEYRIGDRTVFNATLRYADTWEWAWTTRSRDREDRPFRLVGGKEFGRSTLEEIVEALGAIAREATARESRDI